MGIDRTDYIMYGWKLPYNMKNPVGEDIDYWSDDFLPLVEGHRECEYRLIADGMCGKYLVFGICLLSGGDKYEGWDFVSLDINNLNIDKLKTKYKELFLIEGVLNEPTLFIFSNFS